MSTVLEKTLIANYFECNNKNLQVEESGMEVLKKEEKILSKEEAAEFYKQHEGSEHFDQLVEFMSRYCKVNALLWDIKKHSVYMPGRLLACIHVQCSSSTQANLLGRSVV